MRVCEVLNKLLFNSSMLRCFSSLAARARTARATGACLA